jgi:hypothetical protein
VINWDDPLPPIEELHAEAALLRKIQDLREMRVGIEYDLWWLGREEQLAVASLRQES